ncbi:hypothetical protein [Flavobacterium pedocola]
MTDFQILLRGQLLVNLPVTILIIGTSILLSVFLNDSRGTLFIGCALGWICWKIMTPKWILWAVKNGVDKERLYTIGKSGLLVWSKQYVEDVVENNKRPWI